MVALVGAIFGSFANVCIHRLPRRLSVVRPGSHCPHCGAAVRWFDNLPVLSYLLLRGRCRSCGSRISPRYPLVEALSALLFLLLWWEIGWSRELPAYLALFEALLIISFIDLEHQIIPDVISLPGTLAGVLASLFLLPHGPLWAVFGGLVGGGVLYAVGVLGGVLLKQEAMGGGDIKLMAMVGAFLGWKIALLTIIFAAFLGSLTGGAMLLLLRHSRRTPIPFGPYLALGALLALLAGNTLLAWYFDLFLG
ncbi:MAG: prepilin peptidase [Candidatus Tectomicrobia bacterium]|nr:prepilin peptidase [Candidatus Tectomicrobia bacterium]